MKTIGILGGMAWQSSADFYRMINEEINRRLGGQHSCQCVMYSVDLDPVLICRDEGRWDELNLVVADGIKRLEAAGADFSIICSNTMHKTYDYVSTHVEKPVLHIGDVTAAEIKRRGYKKVGILGTRFTLTEDFYTGRLKRKHGIDVIAPDDADVKIVHHVIYDELDYSILDPKSRAEFVRIIEDLHAKGADAVILGCTEIPELVRPGDTKVPLLDTTNLLAMAAVDKALE